MTSQSASRFLVEFAPHSLQLALVGPGGRLDGFRECTLDAAAVAAAVAALSPGTPPGGVQVLLVPHASFTARANAEEAASIRTAKSLLTHAEAVSNGIAIPLSVVGVDSATGQRVDTVGASPWLLAGAATAQIDAAKAQLAALGLPAGTLRLALPVRIGSVVTALQDMPESTRVLVWQVGETDAQLACVSASGCEAAGLVGAGFIQIFEAVQAGLGLKFRAAAGKLFFNNDYDFSETAGPIAERLAALLRPAIATLDCKPTVLHVAGLPSGQAWLAKAVAAALDITLLSPDMPAFCAQCGLSGQAVDASLPSSALGLLFHAAPRGTNERGWAADWLDASAPAPAPVSPPAQKAAEPVTPAGEPLIKGMPAPAAAAVPQVTAAPAPVPAVAKVKAPATAGAKPATKAKAAAVAVAPEPEKPAVPVAAVPLVAKAIAAAPTEVKQPEVAVPAPVAVAAPTETEKPVVETVAPVGESAAAPKKQPVALFAAIGAVVLIGGAAAFFLSGGKPTHNAAPVVAQLSEEQLRLQEAENARMLAEEMKTPRSFRNDRYSFEVSDRGFLRKLVGVGNKTIIDEFGWLELQGMFTGTGKPFNAGAMGDTDFKPSINKTVRDGKVVFEIKGTHPRFSVETLVTCLPSSLKVDTVFNPINLDDSRGPISGVYTVKMNRQSLSLGQKATVVPGSVTYATQSGPAVIKFNGDAWGQAGEEGKQTLMASSSLVFFYFAGGADPKANTLTAELILP